jgi:hypothetical protein
LKSRYNYFYLLFQFRIGWLMFIHNLVMYYRNKISGEPPNI